MKFRRPSLLWMLAISSVRSQTLPVPIQFSAPDQYNIQQTGGYYAGFIAADLNGDGRPDLVFGTTGTAVMLNKGDGTFLPPVVYAPFPCCFTPIAAIDVNGDGSPDLVVFASSPVALCVLLNHGDGTFGQASCNSVLSGQAGIGAGSMTVGDFNGDGRPDVAISYNSTSGPVNAIFANSGTGTLTYLRSFSAPASAYCCGVSVLNAADVNGDGLADIVTNNGYNSFSVLVNLGDGVMASPVTYTTNRSSLNYYFADLNGDGRIDVIWNEQNYAFDYSLNKGSGIFALPPSLNFPGDYYYGSSLAVGDFNNDGTVDVVALWGGTLSFANSGGSSFGAPNVQLQPIACQGAGGADILDAVADFDGDGRLDIACASYNNILVLRNTTPVVTTGLTVTGIFPPQGGNGGTVSAVSIIGTDFPPGVQVKLTGPGPDIIPTSITESAAGNLITVSFNLTGVAPGSYTLVLTDAKGNVLLTSSAAFTVVEGGAANISVDFVGRNVLRAGNGQTYYILVDNRGNVDGDTANLWVRFPTFITWNAPPSQSPTDVFQTGDSTVLFYQVLGTLPAGSVSTFLLQLAVSDDPQYAHKPFSVVMSQ